MTAQWMNSLAAEASDEARLAVFEGGPEHWTAATMEALYAEVVRLAYVDADKAARLAMASRWLADRLGSDRARVFSLRCVGHVAYLQVRHAEAVAAYQDAVHLLEHSGSEIDLGRTLLSGLLPLMYLGRYDEALAWAARAREIFVRHHDELRLARLDSNLGNILYRQDRHADALTLYRQAHETLSRVGQPLDVAAVLSNMAVCSTSLGRFADALEYYEQARACSEQHGMPPLVAAADYNIAYLHYLRGDYVQAMRLYAATRLHCERVGDAYHAALCDLDESEMYLELNLSDEGGQLAARAAAAFEKLNMGYERAKAMVTQASSLSNRGDAAGALYLIRQARQLFVNEQNRVWPAVSDLYQAILFARENRDEGARRLLDKAARQLRTSAMPGKAALCSLLSAQLLLKGGRAPLANEICRRTMTELGETGAPSLHFHAAYLLGQTEEHLGNWEVAYQAYRTARQQVEDLRDRLWGEEMKISILKDKLAVYESLVWMCLWKRAEVPGSQEEAFLYIQQAKSRSLADQIALAGLPWASSTGGLEEGIHEIRGNLNWYYRQIEQTRRSGASAERTAELKKKVREQEELLARTLARRSALIAEGGAPASADSLPFDQIQARIPENATLLEYYEVRGILYVCLLTRGDFRVVPLAPSQPVRNLVRLLQFQMAKFRLGQPYLQNFASRLQADVEHHLRELYKNLIAPIRVHLGNSHLIIAPHGFLHGVPFHALQGEESFLLDEFTVSYTPSASVFALCDLRKTEPGRGSLVLAVADSDAPYIEEEARTAAQLLPDAILFSGEEASEETLRRHGPGSQYLHIAAHGLFRRDNPMFSSIRLGTSLLNLIDIYRLPLRADLVTLSGCSTGLSEVVAGDELVGLMRGLLYAGARGILVSLWDIHDGATAEFMASFYRTLRNGGGKAAAVQAAMREIRARYPHPYYWAPFILVGHYQS
jgi:CHAT domain-containing protein/tetratricopeptide (TPR) repeat protein